MSNSNRVATKVTALSIEIQRGEPSSSMSTVTGRWPQLGEGSKLARAVCADCSSHPEARGPRHAAAALRLTLGRCSSHVAQFCYHTNNNRNPKCDLSTYNIDVEMQPWCGGTHTHYPPITPLHAYMPNSRGCDCAPHVPLGMGQGKSRRSE